MKAIATSFATLKDLRNYINCLLEGSTATECYSCGDNGTGAWGANTAQLDVPMCALPVSEMKRRWGTSQKAKGKRVLVKLVLGHGQEFECELQDKGPEGVVDLNPAALVKAGLRSDTELTCKAEWRWKD